MTPVGTTQFLAILSGSLATGLLTWTVLSLSLSHIPQKLVVPRLLDASSARGLFKALFSLGTDRLKARRSRQRQGRLTELFPQALGMTVQVLKTGQTVPQALDYLSKECPEPLREEIALVCGEIALGTSTEEALTHMAGRYPEFSDLQRFLEAFKVSRMTGADLTHLLEVLLEGIEEKGRILRKMDAMTAQGRLSGALMGLLPVLLGTVFFILDPTLMAPLFTEKAGWALLLLAAFLETVGFLWIRQLLRVEV